MIIYKDLFTDDELISDSYQILEENAAVLKVKSKFVQKKDEDYGIADNSDEGGDGSGEGSSVNMVVDAFKLTEITYTKKDYAAALKAYMGKLKQQVEKNHPERLKDFMDGCTAFSKKVISKFNDFQFFMGESCDPAGMIILQDFEADGMTPVLYYFKDGLKEEKV